MNALLKETVIGTFTHTMEYLPSLERSIEEKLPGIQYIRQLAPLPINQNFEELRKRFQATGKRFWVFLDHDIQFVDSDTIRIALETLIRGHYAAVGVYSSYYKDYHARAEELVEREVGWVPGYFQMVDSRRVGHIGADMNLPDPNTSIDTSYCVSIRKEGYKIGIAPTWVYHQYKPLSLAYLSVIEKTNQYLFQKWGQFYFDTCVYCGCLIGPDPGADVWNMPEGQVEVEIQQLFEERSRQDQHGGMGDLMLILRRYASECESVTEFGVQKGSSTIAFACAKPKVFRSYEINDVMDARVKALLGRFAGWQYKMGDSREVEIDETDLLFIDSDHTGEQLMDELYRHEYRVRKYILLHDTVNCALCGERPGKEGLLAALNEFLEDHLHWSIEMTYMQDHGLTVLRRTS